MRYNCDRRIKTRETEARTRDGQKPAFETPTICIVRLPVSAILLQFYMCAVNSRMHFHYL